MVEQLERDGAGLNLTEQVRDGHRRPLQPGAAAATLEGRIVRVIDRVAYINHDIDDALRAGLLREEELPAEPIAVLGATGSARIDALVHDMVEHSAPRGRHRPGARGRAGDERAARLHVRARLPRPGGAAPSTRGSRGVVRALFEHYVAHPELLPAAGRARSGGSRSPSASSRRRSPTTWRA